MLPTAASLLHHRLNNLLQSVFHSISTHLYFLQHGWNRNLNQSKSSVEETKDVNGVNSETESEDTDSTGLTPSFKDLESSSLPEAEITTPAASTEVTTVVTDTPAPHVEEVNSLTPDTDNSTVIVQNSTLPTFESESFKNVTDNLVNVETTLPAVPSSTTSPVFVPSTDPDTTLTTTSEAPIVPESSPALPQTSDEHLDASDRDMESTPDNRVTISYEVESLSTTMMPTIPSSTRIADEAMFPVVSGPLNPFEAQLVEAFTTFWMNELRADSEYLELLSRLNRSPSALKGKDAFYFLNQIFSDILYFA